MSEKVGASARPIAKRSAGFQRSIVFALLLVGGVVGALEFRDRAGFVTETDARIAGKLVTVSSRVAGWVTEIAITQGERLRPDQILARIDDRDSKLLVNQLEDQVRGSLAAAAKLRAVRDLTDKQTQRRYETQLSRLRVAEASLASLDAKRELARNDLKRAASLRAKRVIAEQQLDQTRTAARQMESEYKMSAAEVEESQAVLQEVLTERARVAVIDQEVEILRHELARLRSQLQQQKLDLADRTIRSSVDGVVDRVFVEQGEYVTPGQRLAVIHDPTDIWIDANIKETEIRRLRLNQIVEVSVDAYPDDSFEGRIQSIGDATTASFALLPNPNPSGNFTKVTQRLPVRIAVHQNQDRLRPGMMVEIRINVHSEEAR